MPGRAPRPTRIAVFASGSGSNLQALLEAFPPGGSSGAGAAEVALVVSDRPGIGALDRAETAGVTARVIAPRDHPDPTAFADALLGALREAGIELVALAGYLRLVPAPVVAVYRGRILNIHPAPLPTFGGPGMHGRHVHEAVLRAGVRVSGPTVHFVDERYDTGPIVAQWPVPVRPGDTPESLAARVLRYEHRLYPAVVRALVDGSIVLEDDGRVGFGDGGPGGRPGEGPELGFALAEEAAALESVEPVGVVPHADSR